MHLFIEARPVYYVRRGIPAELRPLLAGKHEFSQSLGTKDRATPKQRIPALTIETDALLASARERLDAGERPASEKGGSQAYALSDRDMSAMAVEAALAVRITRVAHRTIRAANFETQLAEQQSLPQPSQSIDCEKFSSAVLPR